jgi:hypothetical protein
MEAIMPNLIERVRLAISPKVEPARMAYELAERSYTLAPATVMRMLSEVDSQLLDLILRQQGFERLGDQQLTGMSEAERTRFVMDSRYMYQYDVQTWRAVQMWTDFGFGQSVYIEPQDENAVDVWKEFWEAKRNSPLLKQRKLHQMSNELIRDGELFFVLYINQLNGQCTIRRFMTDQVQRIVYADQDDDTPMYYIHSTKDGDVWYADWAAEPDDLAKARSTADANTRYASAIRPYTDAVVVHAAINEINGRGVPQFSRAFEWSRAYKNFLQDRATVARVVAMFVDEYVHKGGSRAQEAIRAKFASSYQDTTAGYENNPSAPAGSALIHNEQVTANRRPLATAAGDAQLDGMMLLGQVSAGTGAPLHWMGRPDAMQNRATAKETERPWVEQMKRYQQLWSDTLGDVAEVVLRSNELYSSANYETYAVTVTLDTPIDVEVADVNTTMTAVTQASLAGTINSAAAQSTIQQLVKIALTALGVADVEDVVNVEPPEGGAPAAAPTAPGNSVIPSELQPVIRKALQRYQEGKVSDQQFAVYMAAIMREQAGEQVDG